MNAAKHTPGPWRYQEGADVYTHIIRGDAAPGSMVCHLPQDSTGRSEANARRIVQCVNAHDELVQALREVSELLDWALGIDLLPPGADGPAAKARAAISKATGGAA